MRIGFLVLLAAAGPAVGQTITQNSTSAGAASGTSLSWAHTLAAGDNRMLVVGLGLETTTAAGLDLSGVTVRFNGTLLTRAAGAGITATQSKVSGTDFWYLPAGSAGSATVGTISVTTASAQDAIHGLATAVNNVLQGQAPVAARNSLTGTNLTSVSTPITPAANGSWAFTVANTSASGTNGVAGGPAGHVEYAALQQTADSTTSLGRIEAAAGGVSLSPSFTFAADGVRLTMSSVAFAPVPEPAAVLAVAAVGLVGWWRGRAARR